MKKTDKQKIKDISKNIKSQISFLKEMELKEENNFYKTPNNFEEKQGTSEINRVCLEESHGLIEDALDILKEIE